jgi:hypothetical protein
VKNGDKQFWKEKFLAANWKAQNALMNNTGFFFLRVGGGRGGGGGDRDFLFFPLFPMGSLVQVSIENVYHVLINSHCL